MNQHKCHVFYREQTFFIVCYHKTYTGLSVAGNPMISISVSLTKKEIGDAIIKVLKSSRDGIPVPEDHQKDISRPLLQFMRFSSWDELQNSVDDCALSWSGGDSIIVKPYKRDVDGFSPDVERFFTCRDDSISVCEAIMKVFKDDFLSR